MQTDYPQLVQAATLLIDNGITDRAANLLAYVLAQPDVHPTTYNEADLLFDELNQTICPRVIWDAREFAEIASPADVITVLQAALAEDV